MEKIYLSPLAGTPLIEYLKQKGYRVSVAHRDLKLAEGVDGQLINASAKPVEGR